MSKHPAQRGTIKLEDARVLSHQSWPGNQYILRIEAPRCAAHARPGSFVHLQCDEQLPMRRPLSIMRVNPQQGWVDLLYKVEGYGTGLLARRQPGETLSVLGPIGQPFQPDSNHRRPLLIGGGVGIPPMVFLAEQLQQDKTSYQPLVIMGSEIPFPFERCESVIPVDGLSADCTAAMPLLEELGIASRLASQQGYPGTFSGYVTELASSWLDTLDATERQQVNVFACGPHPMLATVAQMAEQYQLPCQVSLEEYMACAVGGCAGCVVEVKQPGGNAMKRVCVDGPVFDAREVFF
ncbi:MAG TPA: dihydroorotate dehydrogenase electron transfer subunit [Gammaproteobacteria bacterium]|nr:dihydroorotate dehydrogenase electron transfer subunit [Gammaproteobacteria bacterium]